MRPDNLDRHKNFFLQIFIHRCYFSFYKARRFKYCTHRSEGKRRNEANPCLMSSAILGDKNKLNGRCKNALTFNIISPGIIYESLRHSITHLFLIKYRLMNSTWHLVIHILAFINGRDFFSKFAMQSQTQPRRQSTSLQH